jgi:hypothetical protein
MAITWKPIDEPIREEPSQAAYEAYLRKGGSTAQAEPEEPKDVRFTLQIPGPLCAELDRLRAQRLAKTSRHQWVLEAIEQRIERETRAEASV